MRAISIWSGIVLACFAAASVSAAEIEQWGVAELTFGGPSQGNPYLDIQLRATFTQGDRAITVPGFWDGGDVYKVRFSPPTPGQWQYRTSSNRPELDGHTGTITAAPPSEGNRGPVEIFHTFYFRYADGTPYHQFGTTCYAWIHQPEELQQQTLKTLASSPFNKIRFCIFPKSYAYNQNEPELFAFVRKADGSFDFSRPDPAFWRHLERRILDLQQLGIQADLILWHPYDRWGFADMSDEEDDRYLRYCIARLSAYRDVWWSLANEYDFMTDRPAGHRGNKQWEDWDRFFQILQNEDPHRRFRGIHNGRKWYDHTMPWVTHASLQSSDMNGGVRFRNQYQKPVIYDECRYEGDIPQGWGNLTAREMTQRFWLGTLSGCYVGHGETYKHPQDILWWSKGGVLHGQSPARIAWLKEFLTRCPPFHELEPMGDDKGRFLLAKPGEFYLIYCVDQRKQTVNLAEGHRYKIDLIDPWEMTVTALGTAEPGEFTVVPPRADVAFRLEAYQPGEPLRPQVQMEASATEGLAPLEVEFRSPNAGKLLWDFGDGTTGEGPRLRHVFQSPGVYSVALSVTTAEGQTATAFQEILVDHDPHVPIVRAGFASGEVPTLKFQGSAKRGAVGALVLPAGPPWGWVEAGESVVDGLRGLRSFTILGWLKPDNLQAGSGGNRIVFCLQENHSGIDLVCHADGRLRLAVNQWPDRVQNDSSPGKLQLGKWTFFAVTYDAAQQRDNVRWYFSEPREAPGRVAIVPDRTNSYNVGPVDTDIGPLAIGNFNKTMHGYGMDRQFRGEIRGLQIFGSRVGGRGALSLEMIREHQP